MAMKKSFRVATFVIGVLQIILAIILIGCSFALESYKDIRSMSAWTSPHWAGFLYLLPAISGILLGVTGSIGYVFAVLFLNICMAILMIGPAVLTSLTTLSYSFRNLCDDSTEDCPHRAFEALLATVMVVCYLCDALALAGSILGCVGLSGTRSQRPAASIVREPWASLDPAS